MGGICSNRAFVKKSNCKSSQLFNTLNFSNASVNNPGYQNKILISYYANEKERLHRRHDQIIQQIVYSDTELLIGKINFSYIKQQEEICDHTAAILYFTPHLKQLKLNNAQIGPQELRQMQQAISNLKKLEVLQLSNNPIGNQGSQYLSEILPTLFQLRSLQLKAIDISLNGAINLAQTIGQLSNLEVVELDENNLLTKGCILIIDGLKPCYSLTELSIQYNLIENQGAEKLLSELHHWPKLKKLKLQGNNISEEFQERFQSLQVDIAI